MSIWATFLRFDDDTAPVRYLASHVFPDPNVRAGSVQLASIPGFIRVDGPDVDDEDLPPHPFVRLSVNEVDVVLDREQVLEMYHDLGEWLGATKITESGGPPLGAILKEEA